MATYKITATVTTTTKVPQRGERESVRYALLRALGSQAALDHELVSQATRRSLKVRRVR